MVKRVVALVVGVVVAVGLGAVVMPSCCPGLWARLKGKVAEVTGWTEEAREADPVGFIEHVRARLQKDLEVLQKTRRELMGEIGAVSEKLREQEALREHARALAVQFRSGFHAASKGGGFPIQVCGAAYTQEEARSQVSLLLAEEAGYEAAIKRLKEVAQQAERELERLTVRINKIEAQLTTLGAEREIVKARRLSQEEEQLLAQAEQLLDENRELVAVNPVRTVRELLAAAERLQQKRPIEAERVEQFLAERPQEVLPQAQPTSERQQPGPSSTKPRPNTPQAQQAQFEEEPSSQPVNERVAGREVEEKASPARSATPVSHRPENPQPAASNRNATPGTAAERPESNEPGQFEEGPAFQPMDEPMARAEPEKPAIPARRTSRVAQRPQNPKPTRDSTRSNPLVDTENTESSEPANSNGSVSPALERPQDAKSGDADQPEPKPTSAPKPPQKRSTKPIYVQF